MFLLISQHLDRKVGRRRQKFYVKKSFLQVKAESKPCSGEDSGQIFLLSCTAVFQGKMMKIIKCEKS